MWPKGISDFLVSHGQHKSTWVDLIHSVTHRTCAQPFLFSSTPLHQVPGQLCRTHLQTLPSGRHCLFENHSEPVAQVPQGELRIRAPGAPRPAARATVHLSQVPKVLCATKFDDLYLRNGLLRYCFWPRGVGIGATSWYTLSMQRRLSKHSSNCALTLHWFSSWLFSHELTTK